VGVAIQLEDGTWIAGAIEGYGGKSSIAPGESNGGWVSKKTFKTKEDVIKEFATKRSSDSDGIGAHDPYDQYKIIDVNDAHYGAASGVIQTFDDNTGYSPPENDCLTNVYAVLKAYNVEGLQELPVAPTDQKNVPLLNRVLTDAATTGVLSSSGGTTTKYEEMTYLADDLHKPKYYFDNLPGEAVSLTKVDGTSSSQGSQSTAQETTPVAADVLSLGMIQEKPQPTPAANTKIAKSNVLKLSGTEFEDYPSLDAHFDRYGSLSRGQIVSFSIPDSQPESQPTVVQAPSLASSGSESSVVGKWDVQTEIECKCLILGEIYRTDSRDHSIIEFHKDGTITVSKLDSQYLKYPSAEAEKGHYNGVWVEDELNKAVLNTAVSASEWVQNGDLIHIQYDPSPKQTDGDNTAWQSDGDTWDGKIDGETMSGTGSGVLHSYSPSADNGNPLSYDCSFSMHWSASRVNT